MSVISSCDLSASALYDRTWAGESREYYFGPQGKGTAPQLSVDEPRDCVCRDQLPRRFSHVAAGLEDLLSEQNNEELAKADSSLTTLFAGKDFGEDILGAFSDRRFKSSLPDKFLHRTNLSPPLNFRRLAW